MFVFFFPFCFLNNLSCDWLVAPTLHAQRLFVRERTSLRWWKLLWKLTYKFASKSAWNIQSSPSTWYRGIHHHMPRNFRIQLQNITTEVEPPSHVPTPQSRAFSCNLPQVRDGFRMKGGSFCDHFFPLGGRPWFFGGGILWTKPV